MSTQPQEKKYKRLLERLEAAVSAGDHPIPIGKLLGFHVVEVGEGRGVVEMNAEGRHSNPMGTLHGGALCTIADTAMGVAHISLLKEDESSTTLEMKINFVRPFWQGKVRAVGSVVKHGRTVTLLECDVTDEADNLLARASSTYMTLRGEQARGR